MVAGIEPASIGALPIELRATVSYLSSFSLIVYSLALPLSFTTTIRALHGFTITSEDISGVVNALTCCVPVTRPASTKLTDSPQREQRCGVSIA